MRWSTCYGPAWVSGSVTVVYRFDGGDCTRVGLSDENSTPIGSHFACATEGSGLHLPVPTAYPWFL